MEVEEIANEEGTEDVAEGEEMEDGGQRLGVEVTKEIVEEGEIEEVIVGEEEEGDGGTADEREGRKDWSEEGESGSRRERSHSGSETGVSTRASSRSGR
ncbi:hypothetical protein KUCAC02_031446 [Chaenocephalus aceratus]|nr:hypothetical protein KUCAC02_031446 [Chaenocephalus aceratus]